MSTWEEVTRLTLHVKHVRAKNRKDMHCSSETELAGRLDPVFQTLGKGLHSQVCSMDLAPVANIAITAKFNMSNQSWDWESATNEEEQQRRGKASNAYILLSWCFLYSQPASGMGAGTAKSLDLMFLGRPYEEVGMARCVASLFKSCLHLWSTVFLHKFSIFLDRSCHPRHRLARKVIKEQNTIKAKMEKLEKGGANDLQRGRQNLYNMHFKVKHVKRQ